MVVGYALAFWFTKNGGGRGENKTLHSMGQHVEDICHIVPIVEGGFLHGLTDLTQSGTVQDRRKIVTGEVLSGNRYSRHLQQTKSYWS